MQQNYHRDEYRTRYFRDSGIIGSKEFVFSNYQRFKHLLSASEYASASLKMSGSAS
jgi:hypothetical protein